MALQTEWLRLGRSGKTVDGRIIEEQWLDDIAETYDTKNLITAKIWPDHNRYVNYGKVLDVRVEKNDVGGKDLYGILEPNAYYQSDVRYGQRVNLSMEITPNFLKSGKAYLTGLGATDDPASLATSEVKFSKYAEQAGIVRSDFIEKETKVFDDPEPNTLFNQIKELFRKNNQEANDMAEKAELKQISQDFAALNETLSKLIPGASGKGDMKERLLKLSNDLTLLQQEADKTTPEQTDPVTEKLSKMEESISTMAKSISSLTEKLSAQTPSKEAETPEANAITAEQFKSMTDQLEAFGKKLADALKEQPGTPAGEHFNADDDDSKDIV